MGSLIAVDPGATMGWAFFDYGELHCAGFCKNIIQLPHFTRREAVLVVEMPTTFKGMTKGDPDKILKLAELAGAVRGRYEALYPGIEVVQPKPMTWKGAVPKEIHNARTLKKLKANEIKGLAKRPRAKDFDHNMLDAVGLGLWYLEKEGIRIPSNCPRG